MSEAAGLLDIAALRAAPGSDEPFAHVVVPGFVPPEALAEVVRDLPALSKGGSFPTGSLRLGPRARALMDALEGPAFRAAIAARFRSRSGRCAGDGDAAGELAREGRADPL